MLLSAEYPERVAFTDGGICVNGSIRLWDTQGSQEGLSTQGSVTIGHDDFMQFTSLHPSPEESSHTDPKRAVTGSLTGRAGKSCPVLMPPVLMLWVMVVALLA